MTERLEVQVLNIYMDRANQSPVLLLKELDGARILPIWIGFFEAQSILWALKGIMQHRPLTHDLFADVITLMGGRLAEVYVHDFVNGTYFACLSIEAGDRVLKLDARPSDAVAIALRQGCPVFVSERIMEKTSIENLKNQPTEELENVLIKLPDEFFGKYNM